MSAEIVPFRARAVPTPEIAGMDRLQQALSALDLALANQRAAVADFRYALTRLADIMGGLGASLQQYGGSLEQLEEQVGTRNMRSVALEARADKALAAEGC